MTLEQAKADMDGFLLLLIEAMRPCKKLEYFAFIKEAPSQYQPDPCSIAPALAMIENATEGFWPNFRRAPYVTDELPVQFTPADIDLYLTKIREAFVGGAFRTCTSLMYGFKEGIFVEARRITELLQQISTPLPMLKRVGIYVSAQDKEGTAMLLRELALFVWGGDGATSKCPSLEKMIVILDEHRLSYEGLEFLFLLVEEAMRHPSLRVVEVLFNHDRPGPKKGEKEMENGEVAIRKTATTSTDGEDDKKKEGGVEGGGGGGAVAAASAADDNANEEGFSWEDNFLDNLACALLEDGRGIPTDRTVELILSTVQTLNPDQYESYIRYSHHRGCRPALDKFMVDGDVLWDSLPLPYKRFGWNGCFDLPGQEKKWVHDLRATRIRADAEVDGGEMILTPLKYQFDSDSDSDSD
jgi:hypothetical protein